MLIFKRRFSRNTSSILSGEGLDKANEANRRSCIFETKVTVMLPVKPEETLHNYLRRHYERISKINELQLAEQRKAANPDVVTNRSTTAIS